MNTIEQQKNRIFICTLATIAVVVNAGEEFKYARAHPVFTPQVVRQTPPPIRSESVVQSPPAYSPAQTTIAPSEPVISSQPPVEQVESEVIVPFAPVAKKERPAPLPKQMQEHAVEVSHAEKAMDNTSQFSAKKDSETASLVTPAKALPGKWPGNLVELPQEEQTATDGLSHQANSGDQTVPADIPKPQTVHYEKTTSPQYRTVPPQAQPHRNGGNTASHTSSGQTKTTSSSHPSNSAQSSAKKK